MGQDGAQDSILPQCAIAWGRSRLNVLDCFGFSNICLLLQGGALKYKNIQYIQLHIQYTKYVLTIAYLFLIFSRYLCPQLLGENYNSHQCNTCFLVPRNSCRRSWQRFLQTLLRRDKACSPWQPVAAPNPKHRKWIPPAAFHWLQKNGAGSLKPTGWHVPWCSALTSRSCSAAPEIAGNLLRGTRALPSQQHTPAQCFRQLSEYVRAAGGPPFATESGPSFSQSRPILGNRWISSPGQDKTRQDKKGNYSTWQTAKISSAPSQEI